MQQAARKFFNDTSGATAIEYALLAGLISVAIVSVVATLAVKVTGLYQTVAAVYP
jgi:pilus assembly protein Flp/PilA